MKFLIMTLFILFACAGHTLIINPADEGINPNEENGHNLFTEILKEYVSDGKVSYRDLSNDNRLEEYISKLAATDPEKIQRCGIDRAERTKRRWRGCGHCVC